MGSRAQVERLALGGRRVDTWKEAGRKDAGAHAPGCGDVVCKTGGFF